MTERGTFGYDPAVVFEQGMIRTLAAFSESGVAS